MTRYDCDVLIVGAGPVGQTTALLLAQRGISVIVLERWEQPYPLPRAVALAHDVVRTMHTLALGTRFADLLDPWGRDGQQCVLESADGRRLTQASSPLDSVSGHPEMSGFSQPDLELVLEDHVNEATDIDQRRGVTVRSLRTNGDHVCVQAAERDSAEVTLSARYVVGCDGANSIVREHIGAPITDMQFDRDWLVVDVVPNGPLPKAMSDMGQRLDPARPTTFVPAGPNRRRFEFMIQPGDDAALLDTDDGTWELLRPWGVNPANSVLTRHARYTFRGRWATQWRKDRILLAGDAAHQMPPFLGQGLNSGIRDATNLAWRLALVVKDVAPAGLLDDYVAERREQAATIVRESVRMGEIICTTDPEEAARRDELLKTNGHRMGIAQTSWPLNDGTFRKDTAAGTLALQARVGVDGVVGMLDDVTEPGRFMILGADGDPLDALDPALVGGWRSLGGVAVHFGGKRWVDVDGKYGRWFDTLGARVVLIRPDFHVFGTASGDSGSINLLVADLLRSVTQLAV
ncbi:bifunctional 3-(3-hydroxy-phenyl)propionate/3-hydroxycinnamic acid hydroxylase [Mycolicibacterium moriokaense]|uniref:Flavoprotein hydroxylase n=1 Tax=Mycolicibacterium moriokaense TaxID=39691 RepID=A0A318H9L1_9MYCO|nr:bifunctional 3-(3-hydroxy-phenyl)propionate/3-hydroxycinnamic acid hydroxylase [Mycolicibacterium moriokaense]PXX03267.1 flavoprotein hydroxylase [Mycolicibacterium moriokaense]